jgi:hypothetical protein
MPTSVLCSTLLPFDENFFWYRFDANGVDITALKSTVVDIDPLGASTIARNNEAILISVGACPI